MPSIFTHSLVPISLKYSDSLDKFHMKLLWMAIFSSILPDLDSIGFFLCVPYASQWGHRGFTHSVSFAFVWAMMMTFILRKWNGSGFKIFLILFLSTLSHSVLDAFTNGGLGVAFLWPYSEQRYFFPVRPIKVSPMGLGFFSGRGMVVLGSELFYVGIPCVLFIIVSRLFQKIKNSFD